MQQTLERQIQRAETPRYAKGVISVVIPNWNGKHFLPNCIDSLLWQSYGRVEVIIVDNGSADGSVEFIQERYPQVKVISLDKNTGFSFAVNTGIRASNSEYVALLNNDTVVEPSWLEEMEKALREHPDCGSAACKMLAYDDRTLLDGAGDGYRRGGLPGRIGHREIDYGQFDTPRYILGACGGAALYRRSMLEDIGLFDEDYFAYLEDVDLGLRAQSAGYKCIYVPAAIMYHLGCGTTGSGYNPMVVRLSAQNNWNTLVKNVPNGLMLRFLPYILYWQLYYFAVVIVRGGQLAPWFAGSISALKLLPRMLEKRRQIEQRRRVPLEYLEELIIQSEQDLASSKARVNQQAIARAFNKESL